MVSWGPLGLRRGIVLMCALQSPDTASRLVQGGSYGVGGVAQAESEPSGPFREAVVAF